jgi:haloalkane dehalogenase
MDVGFHVSHCRAGLWPITTIGTTVPDLHHREAGTPGDPAVLLVHGYPESSHMWQGVLPALAGAGFHALAPDLAGYGDSEPGAGGGAWERHVEALERFRLAQGLNEVALVVHDWGGLIGLRWACDHPGAAWALAISDTGFFADGKWHGLAKAMQTEGQGEELVDGMTEEGFAAMLGQVSSGIGPDDAREYFKAYADEPRRRGQLELYRSGDFSQLAPYEGRLAALGVPALLLWGEDDPFAPVAGAERFQREIPGAELEVVAGTGHFVVDDAPERYAELLTAFLTRARPGTAR